MAITIRISDTLKRFLTFKTSQQLEEEKRAQRHQKRIMETPTGLRSFIDDKQEQVDKLRETTDAFLSDIEAHFGEHAVYLGPAHTGRTKYENIELGAKRRIAIKWVDFLDGAENTIAFVYTETEKRVRVDYVRTVEVGFDESRYSALEVFAETPNDEDETFRTVRRYDSHEAFMASGHKPPAWFIDILKQRRPIRA